MSKDKNNAKTDFLRMIYNSWTFAKMTQQEKAQILKIISEPITENATKGTHAQRWAIYQALYNAFLIAIGYTGAGWREEHPEKIPF